MRVNQHSAEPPIEKDIVLDLYVNQHLAITPIADLLGTKRSRVYRLLQLAGVTFRLSPPQLLHQRLMKMLTVLKPKNEMENAVLLLRKQGMTFRQIEAQYGIGRMAATRAEHRMRKRATTPRTIEIKASSLFPIGTPSAR